MKNLLAGVKGQFGKVENVFAFSPVTGGLAVKTGNGQFVAFQDGQLVDVQGLTLDFKVPAFKLPVNASEVKAGDVVQNGAEYLYVTAVADGYVEAVSPARREKVSVLPTTNLLFGKPFFTVVRTIDGAGAGFDPTMLMLMSDGGSKDDLLPFLLMSGGLNGQQGQMNPMMLMALQDSTDDLLPLLLMQQGGALGEGFNPLMMLAMGGDKGGKLNDLLPLLMMQQGGGAAGGINPMMLMMMGDGGSDMKDLMMMQALSGGNGFNLFGAK